MSQLRVILTMGLHDLRLTLREKSALFWTLAMPIAFIGLIGSVFGEQQARTPAFRLTVVDQDQTFLSGRLMESLRREDFVLSGSIGDSVASGDDDRALVIPRGFEDSLRSGYRTAIRLRGRGGSSADADMASQVKIQKAVVRMIAACIETDSAAVGVDVTQEGERERFNAALSAPDRVRTEATTAGRGRAVPGGFAASAPATLVLFMLINTVINGAVLLTEEKASRSLARTLVQPVTRPALIAGRLLGRVLFAGLQAAVLIVAGKLIYNVYWGPSPLGLVAILTSLALACASLGLMLGAIFRTTEQASALGWIVPLFLGAIGGTWWPLEVVSPPLRAIGHVSPAAWAMDGLHALISFGKGGDAALVPSLVLLGYAAVFLAIGARNLRAE